MVRTGNRYAAAALAALVVLGTSCSGGGGDSGGGTPPPSGPGLVLAGASGLATSEAGTTATFTVRLATAPTHTVTVTVSSDDAAEIVPSPTTLTFDPASWDSAQTVMLTGQDDDVADGDKTVHVTLDPASLDTAYGAVATATVTATNADDDAAGLDVSKASLETTEGGSPETFTVRLASKPTADVTVAVASTKASEATVSPTSLTFTGLTWSTPQTVTVTPVDDDVREADVAYEVTLDPSSADSAYAGLATHAISAVNHDNDSPGVLVSTNEVTTTEGGPAQSFTVVLRAAPTASVTITPASSSTAEATVSGPLVFTTSSWATPQAVWVTPVDDAIPNEGQHQYEVTLAISSSDSAYAALTIPPVAGHQNDNDSPGFTVSKTTLALAENGAAGTFTVVLSAQPAANVVFAVVSSDTTEGTVSPASLTFTPGNWSTPQTVTVSPVQDMEVDGNVTFPVTVTPSSTDASFNALAPQSVSVTTYNADTAGLVLGTPSTTTTTEAGGTATFTIQLASKPVAPVGQSPSVTVNVTSSKPAEGTVSPATLTFTDANWSTPQTVTVTGVNDDFVDGTQAYVVSLAVGASTDLAYAFNGNLARALNFTNTDDDVAGIVLSRTSGLSTTEGSSMTDSFTVKLAARPFGDVDVYLRTVLPGTNTPTEQVTLNGSDAYYSEFILRFNSTNWNTPQTVTVASIDDCYYDTTTAYTINLWTRSDYVEAAFQSLFATVTGTSGDDEPLPAIQVTPTAVFASYTPSYNLGPPTVVTGSFTVSLTTCPRGYVGISLGGTLNNVSVAPGYNQTYVLGGGTLSTTFVATPVCGIYTCPAPGQYTSMVTVSQGANWDYWNHPDAPEYVGKTGSSVMIYTTFN